MEDCAGEYASSSSAHHIGTLFGLDPEIDEDCGDLSNTELTVSNEGLHVQQVPVGFSSNGYNEHLHSSYLGELNTKCLHCNAMHFQGECSRRNVSGHEFSDFNSCCKSGKVQLQKVSETPEPLRSIFQGNSTLSRSFFLRPRMYNNSFAFTSMVAEAAGAVNGPQSYRIHGQVFHQSSALLPRAGHPPAFAQLYIIDTAEALEHRKRNLQGMGYSEELLRVLSELMHSISPFVESYVTMKEIVKEEERLAKETGQQIRDVTMVFDNRKGGFDRRRYNVPMCNEIAAVFVSRDGNIPLNRGIVVKHRGGGLKRISLLNPLLDAMTYPLLFPLGDSGWCPDIMMKNDKRLSIASFYRYRLYERPGEFSALHMSRAIFQQFVVDVYCRIEDNNLSYIQHNQKKLRVDSYRAVADFVAGSNDNDTLRIGKPVVLPASFSGGPRNMIQHYQDAMAIVCAHGKPDLFITFTCNPRWDEIQENLMQGQHATDRPDIVARVFKLKLDMLRHDIEKNDIFGKIVAFVGVVEFQKRGLPHAHILYTLRPGSKPTCGSDYDELVSAELPDKIKDPQLFELVRTHMMHGPCGAGINRPCLDNNGKCTKQYPKVFANETKENVNGYPQYRRRDDGRYVEIMGRKLDNRSVVPYNLFLLQKYKAHINVEICSSLQSVKYLYKYCYKGHDAASLRITDGNESNRSSDEISRYVEARYVGAPEAVWRILQFPLQFKSHSIQRLAIHLPDEQIMCFEDGEEEEACERAEEQMTTLTAFFQANQSHPAEHVNLAGAKITSNQLLYSQMPKHFTFSKKNGWQQRKRSSDKKIGRIYFVPPSDSERFHLRLLLLHRKGCTSFENLRTVSGVVYATFKLAAAAMGLTSDDNEHFRLLEEAAVHYFPHQLRFLFSELLIFCFPNDPAGLWNTFKHKMSEDFMHRCNNEQISVSTAYAHIQHLIDGRIDILKIIDKPTVEPQLWDAQNGHLSSMEHEQRGKDMYESLNQEQKAAADKVLAALETENVSRCFFIDGPGGSGKTYLYETLNSIMRSKRLTVLNVAWSGIAAQLLPKGTTVHNAFKMPIPVTNENFMPNIRLGTKQAEKLKSVDVMIWDEAPMAPRYAIEG